MKINYKLSSTVIAFTLSLSFISNCYADIVQTNISGEKLFIKQGLMKVEYQEDNTAIFDWDNERITMISDEHKVYIQTSPEEYCEGMKSFFTEHSGNDGASIDMNAMRDAIIARSIEGMTAAEKAEFHAARNPAVDIIEQKHGEIIAGYKTTQYKITAGDEVVEYIWLSSDKKLLKEVEHLLTLNSFDLSCSVFGGDNETYSDSEEYKALTANAYPLKTIQGSLVYAFEKGETANLDSDDDGNFSEVVKIELSNLPSSTFLAPSTYKKISVTNFMKLNLNVESTDTAAQSIELDVEKAEDALEAFRKRI
ncbi:hypothetical protein ACPUVO_07390 [Pseudocolwellia sp. HL-MZ19]|uniref:hypothetical protein n=1 Tax=Pseudocolwellia sp. HL-MZ19 TaxID=3400846 RepID=UPI003CF24DC9